jgi:ribosome-binding protein aMBF1 (putative translation factor)
MTNESNTTDTIEAAKTEAVAQAKARQAAKKAKPVKAKKPAKAKAKAKAKKAAKAKGKKAAKARTPRTDSKQARFIAAMRTPKGMSIDEAAEEFGWQKHTVRGAIAGAIKKRLGLEVETEQDEKRGTVYRIAK